MLHHPAHQIINNYLYYGRSINRKTGTSLKFDATIGAVDHIYDAEMDSFFNLDRKLVTFVAITTNVCSTGNFVKNA